MGRPQSRGDYDMRVTAVYPAGSAVSGQTGFAESAHRWCVTSDWPADALRIDTFLDLVEDSQQVSGRLAVDEGH